MSERPSEQRERAAVELHAAAAKLTGVLGHLASATEAVCYDPSIIPLHAEQLIEMQGMAHTLMKGAELQRDLIKAGAKAGGKGDE